MRMLPLRLALRYIFSRKSSSIVNLIAIVSVVALSLTIAASLFALSLQNGLESFVVDMYKNIDPEYRIVRKDGSMFDRNILKEYNINCDVSVRKEVNVLLECGDKRVAAVLVGVDSTFTEITSIDDNISSGRNPIQENSFGILLGQGLAFELGISSGIIKPINVSLIKKNNGFFSNIPLLRTIELLPVGVYTLDQDTDSRFAYAPLDRIDELTNDSTLASSLELGPNENFDVKSLNEILGAPYILQDHRAVREYLHKMINSEKWVIFALLMMIAFLASLSLFGTLAVMKKEKEENIVILDFLGFDRFSLHNTFFLLGVSLVAIAVVFGVVIGLFLVALQDYFGILTLGGTTFLMSSFPVEISPLLWFQVLLSIIVIGAVISFFASLSILRNR